MSKLIFTFCCLFFTTKIVSQKQYTEVIALMKIQEECWNRGDIHGFMNYYWKSDSLKFIGSKGITYGWQRTLDNYLKSYPDKATMGILKFTIKEATQLSPTSIYVIGQWELEKEKPVGGYFTLLWKKIKDKWVIVADHTS
ncbi:YybH family protein [Aurantibacillus circumpalustris]|uniref:YybH family protein n=1 Tax=Aurantibacillus circumpalustris TaxID=3036359 RepID=UPI00295B6D82|nr:nuclear transport factor 2 family protein [Aurantibacillus circumpalustris]